MIKLGFLDFLFGKKQNDDKTAADGAQANTQQVDPADDEDLADDLLRQANEAAKEDGLTE